MAYQLKTSAGLGSDADLILEAVRALIFIDPDTDEVKHVSTSNKTGITGVVKGANVAIDSSAWAGTSRKRWTPGSGTTDDDFIRFTSNAPAWDFNVNGRARSFVWAFEAPSNSSHIPIAFGGVSPSAFAAGDLGAGGSTMPTSHSLGHDGNERGAGTRSASTKYMVGMSGVHGTSLRLVHGQDAGSMTLTDPGSITWNTSAGGAFNVNYLDRQNTYSATHRQAKSWFQLYLDLNLTQAQWDLLSTSWFSTLLESTSSGIPAGVSGPTSSILLKGRVR